MARTKPRKIKESGHSSDFLKIAHRIMNAALQHKAHQLRAYDVRGLTLIADSFVICSAMSEPQMKAIRNAVVESMSDIGRHPLHAEGEANSAWLVLDYGDVIFHLFRAEAREYYDLDGLWGDAPQVDFPQ